jgi:hypothetical protein
MALMVEKNIVQFQITVYDTCKIKILNQIINFWKELMIFSNI